MGTSVARRPLTALSAYAASESSMEGAKLSFAVSVLGDWAETRGARLRRVCPRPRQSNLIAPMIETIGVDGLNGGGAGNRTRVLSVSVEIRITTMAPETTLREECQGFRHEVAVDNLWIRIFGQQRIFCLCSSAGSGITASPLAAGTSERSGFPQQGEAPTLIPL